MPDGREAADRRGGGGGGGGVDDDDDDDGLVMKLLRRATSIGVVPHSWFVHFYVLSLLCTVFWAAQYARDGAALRYVVARQAPRSEASMTAGQVILAWSLMGLQGARRAFEQVKVLRPSASRMWIAHWLLGLAFYACTSVSVWVEGAGGSVSPSISHRWLTYMSRFDQRCPAGGTQWRLSAAENCCGHHAISERLVHAASMSQISRWSEEVHASGRRLVSISRMPALHL
ncbi:hypothetical protein GGR56DRAFT_289462 [Xylariaceae sp. FL0804]|nr:hypothetical protein GGR56DRAFT_289462 [Xylariaceae sp. FL0804]